MAVDPDQQGFDRAQIPKARKALKSLLKRFAKEMRASGKEMAVDFLCNGLEAIPVPVLNVALAKTVRKMLVGSPGNPPAELGEVLQILESMQASDERFDEGIALLHIDLAEIAADVRAIREDLIDQRQARLNFMRVKTEARWPIADNRISGLLANTGGGSVTVDEIIIHVERWEPEPKIDYSVPAAPLFVLELRAELNTGQSDYPLFELNDVEPRIFNERGAGADRVVIDLSSPENVRYEIRLQIPFVDLATGDEGTMFWPAADEPPLSLPFVCGPGWQPVEVDKLHACDALYTDMAETLGGMAEALAARPATADHDPEFDARMEALGVPAWVVGGWMFRGFLERFVPLFAQLAPADDRQRALSIVASLLAAAPDESLAELPADSELSRALLDLARGTPAEQTTGELARHLTDRAVRTRLGGELARS